MPSGQSIQAQWRGRVSAPCRPGWHRIQISLPDVSQVTANIHRQREVQVCRISAVARECSLVAGFCAGVSSHEQCLARDGSWCTDLRGPRSARLRTNRHQGSIRRHMTFRATQPVSMSCGRAAKCATRVATLRLLHGNRSPSADSSTARGTYGIGLMHASRVQECAAGAAKHAAPTPARPLT